MGRTTDSVGGTESQKTTKTKKSKAGRGDSNGRPWGRGESFKQGGRKKKEIRHLQQRGWTLRALRRVKGVREGQKPRGLT